MNLSNFTKIVAAVVVSTIAVCGTVVVVTKTVKNTKEIK